jgi:peptidoglycan/LPS O-acetylase OafA/YrhL
MHSPMRWSDVLLSGLVMDAWAPDMRLTAPGPAPNPAGWTIATLVFCWLLYPALSLVVRAVGNGSMSRVMALAMCCYIAGAFPSVILMTVNRNVSAAQAATHILPSVTTRVPTPHTMCARVCAQSRPRPTLAQPAHGAWAWCARRHHREIKSRSQRP